MHFEVSWVYFKHSQNFPSFPQIPLATLFYENSTRTRVSFELLCALMGVGELVLVAPPIWQPEQVHCGRLTASLEEGLANADVVMCLRVQHERLQQTEQFDLTAYRHQYALTPTSLAYAKKDAMVMRPGPMNRGVEIDSVVADGPQSSILQQVQNGVMVRMAILESLINAMPD